MPTDGAPPPERPRRGLADALERIYQGLARLLGALLQPLAWLLDLAAPDTETRRRRADWWRANYLAPVFWLAGPLGLFWLWLVVTVSVNLALQLTDPIPGPDAAAARRAYFYGVGLTITGLGALLAAPFVLIRAWINERQAQTAERQAATAESGQITDRFTKAIDQLGSEQMAVRLGAIYALERIAEDSERDHIPIMETLCAFIRENANRAVEDEPAQPGAKVEGGIVRAGQVRPVRAFPLGALQRRPDGLDAKGHRERMDLIRARARNMRDFFGPARALRADVQAAFAVIGRRSEQRRRIERAREPGPFRLDFRRANLQGISLYGFDLREADLSGSRLEGADLRRAWIDDGDLRWAQLAGANLEFTKLNHVNLRYSNAEGAFFRGAKLSGADLGRSRLEAADFVGAMINEASLGLCALEGANLGAVRAENAYLDAYLEGANLSGAELAGADIGGVSLRFCRVHATNFLRLKGLTRTNLISAFGTLSGYNKTILPDEANISGEDLLHWHVPLVQTAPSIRPRDLFEADYKAWIAAGAPTGVDWRNRA